MLAQHGFSTDDRSIALAMKLPFLFSCENGCYLAGPMLQSADWFNLYLHPLGFHMRETDVPADRAAAFLRSTKTAMLGIDRGNGSKHAVVYTGCQSGLLTFINNKWRDEPSPEVFTFSEPEFLARIDPQIRVATLERISPKGTSVTQRLQESVSVIRQNLSAIESLCAKAETVGSLRSKLNTLFRPLLLDGITMLDLLGEHELAERFSSLQQELLTVLRQDENKAVVLSEYLSLTALGAAAEDYIRLIQEELRPL